MPRYAPLLPQLQRLPHFTQRTWRDRNNATVIHSRIDNPPKGRDRLGFEKLLFPAVDLGLIGWHRAHSQGRITGPESDQGILYAPPEVNLRFQCAGIERFIRQLIEMAAPDVELYLTTVTSAHPWTLRLKQIQYVVSFWRNGVSRILFEASVSVRDDRDRPMAWAEVDPIVPPHEWQKLISKPARSEV